MQAKQNIGFFSYYYYWNTANSGLTLFPATAFDFWGKDGGKLN